LSLPQLLAQRRAAMSIGDDDMVALLEVAIDRFLATSEPEAAVPLVRSKAVPPRPRPKD